MDWTRREFNKTFFAGLAGAVLPSIKQERNLYIFDKSTFPFKPKAESILEKTIEQFSEAGISFDNADILTGKFPDLNLLDVVILLTEQDVGHEYIVGRFTLGEYYQPLKDEFNFPYDRRTANANIGVITPRKYKPLDAPDYYALLLDDPKTYFARVVSHEVGHAYGASHVFTSGKGPLRFYMENGCDERIPIWHMENVSGMRNFIEFVSGGFHSREDLNLVRLQVWGKEKDLNFYNDSKFNEGKNT